MKHKYIVGLYDDEEPLLDATVKLRKAGYQMHEILTPFPVHGLDPAMGLQDSRLHTAGFVIGAIGTLFALIAMSTITAVDWPVNVGGKPFLSFPAFVPITFEVTVLFASIGMTVIFYLRNGLSVFKDPEIIHPRITDDRFAVVYCTKRYNDLDDQEGIRRMFRDTGAVEVFDRVLEEELPANLLTDNLAELDNHHH